jgi:Fe-S-cluster containining protein
MRVTDVGLVGPRPVGHTLSVAATTGDDEGGRPGSGEGDLAAGPFSAWVDDMQRARRGEQDADVPCGTCTACCTSSQFVHIGPDERSTLSRIPPALLFPAPRLPPGHVLLGYDERGHCPMLIDHACSIYEDRPRTCRTYDCRVFAAAGVEVPEGTRVEISRRVRRWRFTYPSPADGRRHDAVRSAATFLGTHPELLPTGISAADPTQIALLALDVHDLFLPPAGSPEPDGPIRPDLTEVAERLQQIAAGGGVASP